MHVSDYYNIIQTLRLLDCPIVLIVWDRAHASQYRSSSWRQCWIIGAGGRGLLQRFHCVQTRYYNFLPQYS
jgi:hypothetical protein